MLWVSKESETNREHVRNDEYRPLREPTNIPGYRSLSKLVNATFFVHRLIDKALEKMIDPMANAKFVDFVGFSDKTTRRGGRAKVSR